MSIDNHCGRDEQRNDFPASQAEAHSLIALEQAALYAAQLAIARWINSSSNAAPLLPCRNRPRRGPSGTPRRSKTSRNGWGAAASRSTTSLAPSNSRPSWRLLKPRQPALTAAPIRPIPASIKT